MTKSDPCDETGAADEGMVALLKDMALAYLRGLTPFAAAIRLLELVLEHARGDKKRLEKIKKD